MTTIDLNDYRTANSRVLTGADKGKYVREQSGIDELFPDTDRLRILIPEDTFSITPSFLEALLSNIVKKYGKDVTLKKLSFVGTYNITPVLHETLNRLQYANQTIGSLCVPSPHRSQRKSHTAQANT